MPAVLELEEQVESDFISENLPDRYEEIDGQIVEMPAMSDRSNTVASRLHVIMGHHSLRADIGETLMEALIKLPPPIDCKRRPDLCYISYERWPKNRPVADRQNGREVVPDLAVEVISPSDFAENDQQEKLVEYFQAGVRQVWVIFPRLRLLYLYDSITTVRGFTESDMIDGGEILPGLSFRLAELFPLSPPA